MDASLVIDILKDLVKTNGDLMLCFSEKAIDELYFEKNKDCWLRGDRCKADCFVLTYTNSDNGMCASKVIKQLQELVKKHGDLPVCLGNEEFRVLMLQEGGSYLCDGQRIKKNYFRIRFF